MDGFSTMMTDKIILRKQDGTEYKDIKSLVDTREIHTNDTSVPFEDGDYLYRVLPNGLEESYLIIQAQYYDEFGGIPAHYQIEVRKTTRQEFSNFKTVNTYNISANSGKININSVDNSVNNNVNMDELFSKLHEVANSIKDNGEQIHDLIEDMRLNVGKDSYLSKYNSFIQGAANHMTLFAPFIPALSAMFT